MHLTLHLQGIAKDTLECNNDLNKKQCILSTFIKKELLASKFVPDNVAITEVLQSICYITVYLKYLAVQKKRMTKWNHMKWQQNLYNW